MSQYIETILMQNGIPQNLRFHQARLDKTMSGLPGSTGIDLEIVLNKIAIAKAAKNKIRLLYSEKGVVEITQQEYTQKEINSVKLVDIGEREYPYKHADRRWIYQLVEEAGTDEIIMVKNGWVTDTSIGNLAFYDGISWYTPAVPLLEGIRRASLLELQLIQPRSIPVSSLKQFTRFKCFNAMIGWEESPELEISLIQE